MNIEKFECERLGNEYKSLLEQICYYLDYKSYISKVGIDKIRDLAFKLETGECEIIQFKNSICKFDVDEKIKEEVEKKEQEKDKEIERLNNIIKSARNLFYEKCRISQHGAYIFNEVDYEELSNILGSDKK